jgi:hypothetical protein
MTPATNTGRNTAAAIIAFQPVIMIAVLPLILMAARGRTLR